MPSASARQGFEDQIPSFMTVFDLDAETMVDRDTVTVVECGVGNMDSKSATFLDPHSTFLQPNHVPSRPLHLRNDSCSNKTAESLDSSPTTTTPSTTESSPLTDPSPSSSPESPVQLVPLNQYPASSFGAYLAQGPVSGTHDSLPTPSLNTFARPMTSPAPRKPRNMKGLSIQPPQLMTANAVAAPESASFDFVKPKIPAMKRKPSQLSLKTGVSDLQSRPTLEVPPSPGVGPILQRRALKHSTSTPHILAGPQTSTFGPPGGMTFPKVLERNESGLSEVLRPTRNEPPTAINSVIVEEESPIKSQVANRADSENLNDRATNEDQKSPGYPEGPVAIYGDNVYLYLEPSAEEASRFDVVINVAREVRNPFTSSAKSISAAVAPAPQLRRKGPLSPVAEMQDPESASTLASFATALEYPSDDASLESPTTPKANVPKQPEYIHMPWDHNTDIAPDLMGLCELIENRTKDGKKVLIHCQQGASRSASLIIAYGLYQCPSLGVNDAYHAAQAKSRWISPNMKLMYSLQDFQKEVSRRRPAMIGGNRSRSGKSPTKHRLTMSADAIDVAAKEPRTAPLPGEDEARDMESNSFMAASRPRGNSTPTRPIVSPGPASAPIDFAWGQKASQYPDLDQQHMHEVSSGHPGDDPMQISSPIEPPRTASAFPPSDPMQITSPVEGPQTAFTFGEAPGRFGAGQTIQQPNRPLDSWPFPPPSPGLRSFSMTGFQSLSFPPVPDAIPAAPSRAPPPPPPASHAPTQLDTAPMTQYETVSPRYDTEEPLMSPRVEVMTKNPLKDYSGFPGFQFSAPQNSAADVGLFSPRASSFPRGALGSFGRPVQVADPRSPPTQGETPIVRSIDDVL